MKKVLLASCMIVLFSIPAGAQEPSSAPSDTIHKNVGTGVLCALLFPGGGHLYARDKQIGGTISGIALLSIMGGYLIVEDLKENSYYETPSGIRIYDDSNIDKTPITIGWFIGGIAWAIGILEAPNAVRRYNANPDIRSASKDTLDLPPWRRKPPPLSILITGGRELRIAIALAIGRDDRFRHSP